MTRFDPYNMPVQQVKRFLVFMYEPYYPSGGWGDFVGSYDTAEDAEKAHPYADDIIDLQTGRNVKKRVVYHD